MRRLLAWSAAGLVLAGATFGIFAAIEASMASAAPSAACIRAEQRVRLAELELALARAFGGVLSFGGPAQHGYAEQLIRAAEANLAAAEEAQAEACVVVTGTPSTSSSESLTTSTSIESLTTSTSIESLTTSTSIGTITLND
jgi:hypothetical protein